MKCALMPPSSTAATAIPFSKCGTKTVTTSSRPQRASPSNSCSSEPARRGKVVGDGSRPGQDTKSPEATKGPAPRTATRPGGKPYRTATADMLGTCPTKKRGRSGAQLCSPTSVADSLRGRRHLLGNGSLRFGRDDRRGAEISVRDRANVFVGRRRRPGWRRASARLVASRGGGTSVRCAQDRLLP